MRRALALLALLLLASTRAEAADGAALNVIGYSADSRTFAFEQYGVQDGSGFPYWDIFVIDLKANKWVKGTPVRALLQEDGAKLSAACDKARADAAQVLKNVTEPAELLAANPSTEVVAARERLLFDRWYIPFGSRPDTDSPVKIRHELVAEKIPLPAPKECPAEDGGLFGLRLTLKDLQTGTSRVIHEDKSIPGSRRCPLAYDVSAVVAQAGMPVTDRLVAIIGVSSRGFEGADHRFIAVPFTLSE